MIEEAISKLTKAIQENTKVNTELMFVMKEFNAPVDVVIEPVTPREKKKSAVKVETVEEVSEEVSEITESDLVELFKSMTSDHRKPVAELLQSFGARKMSDIKADDLAEVYRQVGNIIEGKQAA